MTKEEVIPVSKLFLDLDNYRHEQLENQEEVIEYLIKNEDVKLLAKDIAAHGLSPFDVWGVTKKKKVYEVVEGNRRACALILLNAPSKAPEKDQAYFQKLADESEAVPASVKCAVFSEKKDADLWLKRRHNGKFEGIGISEWSAEGKERAFDGNENALAVKLLDYAFSEGMIDEKERTKIGITTITRYMVNNEVRGAFGITSGVDDPNVQTNISKKAFNKGLQHYLKDLLNNPNDVVGSRTSVAQRKEYVADLIKQGVLSKKKNKTSISLNTKATPPRKKTKKIPRDPSNRRTVIPYDFSPFIDDAVLLSILKEIKSLDCFTHKHAAAMLCRCFLEDVYYYYHEKTIGKYNGRDINKLLNTVVKELEKNTESFDKTQRKHLKSLIQVGSQKHHTFSPYTLGGIVHATYNPTPENLIAAWDSISLMIVFMLEETFSSGQH